MKQPIQELREIINNQKTINTSRLEKLINEYQEIVKGKDLRRLEQIKRLEKKIKNQRRLIRVLRSENHG